VMSPWMMVESEDKRRARINTIAHLLASVPWRPVHKEVLDLPVPTDRDQAFAPLPFQRSICLEGVFFAYLEREHARLERLIAAQSKMPHPDALVIARLKKQKLLTKDRIARAVMTRS